ncbi:L-carnitine dehydratase/bile acid-inducible protein F [Fibrella aestuarina BUZ 2]|uniref:L-carnitine dehydratase/bile acid-inducible protein F n=1 Tax=Fibrella aestuarina BUZ 2 TaxID=1166018 RepID=I0K3D9_9BACT|nr:CoA transferase [Fibrella aestuarina]CCG98642.1 L-carnitine dehydratase/bile acid-inducible protein F [Fibrella aestuarina BUZ 2]
MTRTPTTGPLQGLRILDLTRLLPGPLGTMLMADMGADVTKIENPNSPDYVSVFPPHINGVSVNYLAYNRSKKTLTLDYTTPDGREAFFRLLDTADVVVEQFRPGHLDRLGIGYQAAAARNPGIIYVSITGYGQTGPYAHLAGHDLNYLGLSGVLSLTGQPDEPPTVPGVQLADIMGGAYSCVMATLAAVYARHRTGTGQQVDVSMTDCVMPLLSVAQALYAGTGNVPRRGEMPLSGGQPNYGVYRCRDEKRADTEAVQPNYIVLGTLEPKFWQKFCALVDRPDWLAFMLPQTPDELATYKAQIQALIAERTQAEWTAFGIEHDLLITPVLTLDELPHHPYHQARHMIDTQLHPVAGEVPLIGVPIKFSDTPATPTGWLTA